MQLYLEVARFVICFRLDFYFGIDVMCGHDPLDATSVRGPRLDTLAAFASVDLDAHYPLEGVRIGIPEV